MKRFKEVLLYSGGIDSYIGYFYLNKPQLISFNLGSRYTKKEFKFNPLKKENIIYNDSLKWLGKKEEDLNSHIPFRNLYLALTSVTEYSDTVYICGVKDDNMTDKNQKVFELWSDHFSILENRNIKIISPFWKMTKEDIVKWYDSNYSKENLLNTVSCYSEEDNNYCGKCQACFRKACALYSINLILPFYNLEILNYYQKRLEKNIYIPQRENSIKRYLNYVKK